MPDQQVPRNRLLPAAAGWELVQRPSVVTTGEDKAKFAYYGRTVLRRAALRSKRAQTVRPPRCELPMRKDFNVQPA